MKKIIILIFSLYAIIIQAQAQIPTGSRSIIQNAVSNTAVQSPNAAALFKYSETPVSLYTGVPDISIPIYTIKEGAIEIPISISYHSGGIKVNEEASSVGLGWNLNAGGRVSQVVAGANDFNMYGYYNVYPKNATGTVGSISGCPTPSWNNSTSIYSFYTNSFDDNNSGMATYTGWDLQPDLFQINLPNKTYKAYLDMSKTVKTDYPKFAIAEQANIDFKLIPNGGYVPNSYGGYNFKVTDDNGILYSFDGVQEISTSLTGQYGGITGVSKLLTKIEDPTGRKVNFFYTPISHADRLSGCRNTREDIEYSPDSNGYAFLSLLKGKGLTECNKQTIDESFIEKIEFTNGRIEFAWSDREDINKSKKLSSIKIYNNYKLIKQYDFNYEYFIATDNHNTNAIVTWIGASDNKVFTHRLKLLNVIESLTNEKYSFEYNSTYNLPNKLSFSSDFWGYYNGQNNSDTFIPDPTKYLKDQTIFNITSFNQDQTGYWYEAQYGPDVPPDPATGYFNFSTNNKHYLSDRRASLHSLAGLLTSISYPTGGKTEFEYEPNTFSNYPLQSLLDNTNTGINRDYSLGGGVRIKSIKTKENPGAAPLIKNYIYEELSSNGSKMVTNGILAEMPRYYEIQNRCFKRFDEGGTIYGSYYGSTLITSQPSCPMIQKNFRISIYEGAQSQGMSTLPQGSHIGYSKVIEEVTGKGKTESYFVNNYNKSCLSMISRGSSLAIGNGDMVKQQIYDNNNNLLKEILYKYKFNYPDNLNTYFLSASILEPVTSLVARPVSAVSPTVTSAIIPTYAGLIHNYTISLYKSLLESSTTKEYFPAGSNNYVETKTSTTYNNKYLPNFQNTINPDNSINETNYKYAHEKGNQLLISKNIVGIPLETITTQTENGTTKTLSKIETIYPTSLPDAQIGNFVLPKSVTSYDYSNSGSPTEITLDKYDMKGNLLQYTTKEGIPVSIVWGYNYSSPIAKIEGAQYDNIGMYVNTLISKSNEDALNPINEQALLDAGDNLRKNSNLANYQITTYTYDPLIGVTSITPSIGVREYYKYDVTNRLEKIVDSNNKILREFKYRYATSTPVTYYNSEKSQSFTKNNCTGNSVGSSYTYVVPAGTYSSDISQLAADLKASEDVNSNGQNMANQNGTCISPVSCSFTFSSVVGNPQFSYNSTTVLNGTVNFQVYFSGYGIWQNWSNGVNIGKVGASCIPSANRVITFSDSGSPRQWSMFIDTSGNCTATLISGTVDPSSGNPLNFVFQYQK
ncbi:DUF5977 domain-containing protein [Chryseobacterium oranimense]|uniref:DUF5977 domain-containing protein n=1 Tax=Chryseobacterium oranimense TaxID=421058 RepID=UPI00223654F4|nr:DUF5977 domain-containing protein [Chryseobacterium oranimense]